MPRHLPTLLLYPLLAACGADSTQNAPLSPPQLQLSIDPCAELVIGDLSLATINTAGASLGGMYYTDLNLGGIDLTGLNLGGIDLTGLSLGDLTNITITGYSQAEVGTHQKHTYAAKDGIPLSLDDSIDAGDIFIPEDTEECEQPEYAYAVADGLPDHETGSFPNSENPFAILEQGRVLRISLYPEPADSPAPLNAERLDGLLLNGVPIQMRESYCKHSLCNQFAPANPLGAPAAYGMDDHNAHLLSDNSYHYHGDPNALYPEPASDGPTLIGVAADGYPIFSPWINDDGLIRQAISSYQLRAGTRPPTLFMTSFYDGTFVSDFEYVADSGDLDECNGMLVDGVYGYYVTDTFPYILNCFHGTPDPSFDLVTE